LHGRLAICLFTAALLLTAGMGCAAPTGPDSVGDTRVLPPPARTDDVVVTHYPAQAWFDRTLLLGQYDSVTLDAIASSDLAVFQMRLLWSPEGAAAIRAVRDRNEDIVIIGILSVLSFKDDWLNAGQSSRFPMVRPMWDLLSPFPAFTTEGDTALVWAGANMLNPWTADGYRQQLLMDYVDLVATFATRFSGVADGVFYDYMSGQPYLYPGQNDAVTGWVDLDGDGIDSREDTEEHTAWQQWQRALAAEMQDRFGEGWIQIGNGHLPHDDQQLAQSLSGIAYEAYPTTVWNKTDLAGFELGLEHIQPGWLTPRRGRHWSLLWDNRNRRTEFARAASLITDQFYCLSDFGTVGLDRDRIPYLATANPWIAEDLPDGSRLYSRDYLEGTASLSFDAQGRNVSVGFAHR
jgi:hypothetical protein